MTTLITPDPEAIRPEIDDDAARRASGWRRGSRGSGTTSLRVGVATLWLSVIVLLPLAAIAWQAAGGGWHAFWLAVTSNAALESFRVTLTISAGVTVVNLIFGLLIAWMLVRDDFVGKRLVDAIIDLPFALPTIVAGLVVLALYGNDSPIGVHLAFTRVAIWLALLFVTLPFVVRAVQPVLHELDPQMEEAASLLGASALTAFRRVVLPNILPGVLSGLTMAFARAVGEIGAITVVSGNLPYRTEVASVFVFLHAQNGDTSGAAAVAVVLLAISFAVLLAVGGVRHAATRFERA
jgi:sulfate transport system permease protein